MLSVGGGRSGLCIYPLSIYLKSSVRDGRYGPVYARRGGIGGGFASWRWRVGYMPVLAGGQGVASAHIGTLSSGPSPPLFS